jgi:FKBP-type peptidyl-prolyl cis-trans isomerase 2
VPDDVDVEPSTQLVLRLESGQKVPVFVTSVDGEDVTVDANHPLAGKTLKLDLELVHKETS